MASDISTYMAAFDNRQQLLAGRGWQVARDRVPTRVVYIGGDVTTNVAVARVVLTFRQHGRPGGNGTSSLGQ